MRGERSNDRRADPRRRGRHRHPWFGRRLSAAAWEAGGKGSLEASFTGHRFPPTLRSKLRRLPRRRWAPGAARPLNDPLYLAFAGADALRQATAKGVPGTTMPGFAQPAGGKLTDRQIDLLVEGMIARWGRPGDFKDVAIPPYHSEAAGDPQRGAAAYQTYCSRCHGSSGGGGPSGGSIIDPNYLTLISDQSLRAAIVAGRSDLGMPDWRGYVSGRPMSAQEISDVVAWLASKRPAPAALYGEGAARLR